MYTVSLQSSCDEVLKVTCAAWGAAPFASDAISAKRASNAGTCSDAAQDSTHKRDMAEIVAGAKRMCAIALRDTSSSSTTEFAYELAHADYTNGGGIGGLLDVSQTLPPGDGILRYENGEPVTEESKAYFNREEARYWRERIQLYKSEVKKGTLAGEIINKLYDLQDRQPARFRAMNMWMTEADFAGH